jgi:hypothetical protein
MMAGWHVDAGDPEARVGETWEATIGLQRAGPATPEDWWPHLRASDTDQIERLEGAEALGHQPVFRFVTEAVASDEGNSGVWTALQAGPLVFAAPGRYTGTVQGRGSLVYDTHAVETGVSAIWPPSASASSVSNGCGPWPVVGH